MKCPCGSEKYFTACCDTFITGGQLPATPEELMRSRYTAYTLSNLDYITSTMKSPAADEFNVAATRDWLKKISWLKLEISETSTAENVGFVEFVAHFTENHKKQTLHEKSEFHLEDGRWFYVDGNDPCDHHHDPISVTKIGRNDPCLCGSGKKHKKCCGANT